MLFGLGDLAVISDKSMNFTECQFPHLLNMDNGGYLADLSEHRMLKENKRNMLIKRKTAKKHPCSFSFCFTFFSSMLLLSFIILPSFNGMKIASHFI